MIATTPQVDSLLAQHAPVALGVSGGKDSSAMALATSATLDAIGHQGQRVLIHSDLGRVEWRESLPMCERLAERLGLELVVVRRQSGDMMDRWLTRWANNVQRYADLSCVKLILPWSTAAMRFCTSELKTAIICRDLVKRFPGQTILSAAGIRRDESTTRARAPITKAQPKLTNATHSTSGLDWNPILDWSRDQVLAYHEERGFPLHEAYTRYGSSRVSCAFCVLASKRDLAASVSCADNQDIYREMVDLEIASTFSFQERWLADTAPHILTDQQRDLVEGAKRRAERRVKAESRIPKHLLYTKGWPTCMPTYTEAVLLAEVRHEVAEAVGLEIGYTDPERILERYAELMAANERKNGASAESVLVQGVLL